MEKKKTILRQPGYESPLAEAISVMPTGICNTSFTTNSIDEVDEVDAGNYLFF